MASLLLAGGTGIRALQDRLNHTDTSTPKISLHAAKYSGIGVRSSSEVIADLAGWTNTEDAS